jgi:OOP family OmpA-OmpF porin
MMKNMNIKILMVLFLAIVCFGCGAGKARQAGPLFTPQALPSGQYTPKVDTFLVILDASSSMDEAYGGSCKFNIAKGLIDGMNQTIPDIKVNADLMSFGHSDKVTKQNVRRAYGLSEYSRTGLQNGLASISHAGGTSPLEAALKAATEDLKSTQGKVAVIVFSDGKDMDNEELIAAETMKAIVGNRLCIYTVLVGNDPDGQALLEKIAGISGCGFSVKGVEIGSGSAMAGFVEKVLLEKPSDSDGDGINDKFDRCPKTPKGVSVDKAGCPLDRDADGVPDYRDRCPKSSRGVKVGRNGCAKDSDGDGVADYKDKCSNTPKGAQVNAKGCALPRATKSAKVTDAGTWIYEDIKFDSGSSMIKSSAYPVLNEIATALKQTGMKVEIQGHTDSRGDRGYNMMLSDKRSKAVMKYLIGKGVPASRVSAKGYGPAKPIASNDTATGRARNRRVELKPLR